MVRLDFSIELNYEVLEPSEFQFLIQAARTPQQKVLRDELDVHPKTKIEMETDPMFANRHIRLHAAPGPLTVRYSALVDVSAVLVPTCDLVEMEVGKLPLTALYYLKPSRYCPSDRFFDVAVKEFGSLARGFSRVQAIADWVRTRTRFAPGTTNPSHCAMDTFSSQAGVCRDFSHLMISVCRALNIPARYTTSIDYGADPALGPMDFHACVEVFLSGAWYLIDPTGICNTTGLVRIATGRDASDVAFATIFGSVRWSMPKITMFALEDTDAGIALPTPTELAVSTSAAAEYHGSHQMVQQSA